jgi:hypothetical protein
MDTTGILSIVAIVTSVGGTILALVNHTRVRSMCCGKKLEVSLDVEKTTPPSDKLEIKIPTDSKV